MIKEVITEKKKELLRLIERENEIKNYCYINYTDQRREAAEWEFTFKFIEIPRYILENEVKKLETILLYMKKGKGGEFDIQKAKQRPITDFIEFDRAGFATSIWNAQDKTPSMKYYPKENRVYCFSTNRHDDVVGVVQQLKNCSFTDAVKFILS